MKSVTTRVMRAVPIALALAAFGSAAYAKCGCSISLTNGFPKTAITVSSIKTAVKGSVVYKTQWTGDRLIGAGKSSKFTFDVDSACGKEHAFRFFRQNGKECTRVASCGGTISCDLDDWK